MRSEKFTIQIGPQKSVDVFLESPYDGATSPLASASTLDVNQDHVLTSAELTAATSAQLGQVFRGITSAIHSEQLHWENGKKDRTASQVISALLGIGLWGAGGPALGLLGGGGTSALFRFLDRISDQRIGDLVAAANVVGAHLDPPRAVAVAGAPGPEVPLDQLKSPDRVVTFDPSAEPAVEPGTREAIAAYREAYAEASTPSWLAKQAAAGMWDWGWAGPLNLTVYPLILLAAAAEKSLGGGNEDGTITERAARELERIYDGATAQARAWIREDVKELLKGRRQSFEAIDATLSYKVMLEPEARKVLEALAQRAS
ncbi:MAG: hypothetical protein IT384_17885 [Deltaproteobacteria bacterium]|nr:hypothetical protein [Deltaproteobacteria bacterium]